MVCLAPVARNSESDADELKRPHNPGFDANVTGPRSQTPASLISWPQYLAEFDPDANATSSLLLQVKSWPSVTRKLTTKITFINIINIISTNSSHIYILVVLLLHINHPSSYTLLPTIYLSVLHHKVSFHEEPFDC